MSALDVSMQTTCCHVSSICQVSTLIHHTNYSALGKLGLNPIFTRGVGDPRYSRVNVGTYRYLMAITR